MRWFALVAALAIITVACGDDSGGGASTEAFCAQLEEIEANDNLDLDDPAGLAEFRELTDDAPDEIRPAMERFAAIVEDLEGLDENDPEAFSAVFELFGDPDFLGSIRDLSIFMVDECGLDVEGVDELRELDPDDPAALFGGFGSEGSGESDGDVGLGFGGDGEGSEGDADSSFGDADDADDDPSPSSQLSDHLEDNYGNTSWQPDIVSRGIGSSGDNVTITLGFLPSGVSDDDAIAACDAAAEWAADFYDESSNVNIVINDADGDIAEAPDGTTCVAI